MNASEPIGTGASVGVLPAVNIPIAWSIVAIGIYSGEILIARP